MRKSLALALMVVFAVSAFSGWDHREKYREIREETIPADRSLVWVDGGKNGGITINGWEKNQILVRAKIQTWGYDADEAAKTAAEISIDLGDKIHAIGPKRARNRGWSVSFELFVPLESDLQLAAHNGGIKIQDVVGNMEFETLNGGIKLSGVAGDVHGRTKNGGVMVDLDGETWQGDGLDVVTTNGGVVLRVPSDYNADLETGTVNGGINIDFPVMVRGKISKNVATTIGDGGALIRVKTTNGGVRIDKI